MYWVATERRSKPAQFASNDVRAWLTCLAALVLIAVTLFTASSIWRERSTLQRIDDAGLAASVRLHSEYLAQRQTTIALTQWSSIPTLIWLSLFIAWFRRAYRNLRTFRLAGWTESSFGVVWSCTVPIVNWLRPLLLMNEVWRGTDPNAVDSQTSGREWRRSPVSPLLGIAWAALCLGYGLIPVFRLLGSGDELLLSTHIARATSMTGILVVRALALMLSMFVVVEVSRRQRVAAIRLAKIGEATA